MNCIKCGRELHGAQVFCGECQQNMELYPVKPGTPVHLPAQSPQSEIKAKTARFRKNLPPEMRIRKLRTTVRLLVLALAAVLLAFALTALLTLHLLDQRDQQSRIGQNYQVTAEK